MKEGKERWKKQGGAGQQIACLTMSRVTENIFLPLSILTQSVTLSATDIYTTLYFVNQRNYKTLAMWACALTNIHYFYSLK
jgi:hypothetical protein